MEIQIEDAHLLKNFLFESKEKLFWNLNNLNGVETSFKGNYTKTILYS